jgi:hypothetical protein
VLKPWASVAAEMDAKKTHTKYLFEKCLMSHADGKCQSQEMPTQLKQVLGSCLSSKIVSHHTAE